MTKLLILLALLSTNYALAKDSNIQVWGHFYQGCEYNTGLWANFDITYENTSLEYGTRVVLVLGDQIRTQYIGSGTVRTWQNQKEIEMNAIDGYTWRVRQDKSVKYRDSSRTLEALNFVFKIISPNGNVYYDKGNQSLMGYYITKGFIYNGCRDQRAVQLKVTDMLKNN